MTQQQPDDDERQFTLLAEYLEQVQSGERPDRVALLARHPDLAGVIDCLDALECMAPRPSEPPPDDFAGGQSAVTVPSAGERALERQLRSLASPAAGSGESIEFGDYAILEELGRGGMGVVYRARQKSLDRIVALKMILASHLASPDQVSRFHSEAKAAAGVSHPHVVGIYEAGQIQGQHYFAMEYVAGESLAERLVRRRMEPLEAAALLIAVAQAVQHLHERGIVHRDLKPPNILIDPAGRPVVTDFGLAKSLFFDSELTATGAIVGTPPYMAPEQAAGRGDQIGPRTDVYALGAVLYELLTGQPPFRDENPALTLLQVLEREPILPRQLDPRAPRALEAICLKCLEKAPPQRYASAADVAEDLRRFMDGEDLLVKPPDRWRRIVRWARSKPAFAMRIGALACFYAVEAWNYWGRAAVDARFHWSITALVAAWLAASIAFQRWQERPAWTIPALFAAAAADALCFLAALLLGDGVASPMVYGLFVLTAGSALWFRRRLVWFTAALSAAGYAVLAWEGASKLPPAETVVLRDPLRHAFFLISLALVGAIASYQVARINSMSRYFENRQR